MHERNAAFSLAPHPPRHEGNIYIVEDRSGGEDDGIWFAKDRNMDGDPTDPGEGIGRWASNGTEGSESPASTSTPADKRRAWVNIQHPDSGNDRTIEITIPHHRGHGDGGGAARVAAR